MSHNAIVLEDNDVLYVGILDGTGEYKEIRIANTQGELLLTTPEGSTIVR